ncbi:MAG: hypothetical protein LBJ79_00545 [Endomicrobium sp.]|nr:hypothetical protein [Endomicrobium sp.]
MIVQNNVQNLSLQIREYISGIYNSIALKDVGEHKKVQDISRLERVICFMADNIGNLTSIKKISDIMSSDGFKIHPQTLENYIDALCATAIFSIRCKDMI